MNGSYRQLRVTFRLLALTMLVAAAEGWATAQPNQQQKQPAKTVFSADEVMAPMDHIGPLPRPVDLRGYDQVIRVGLGEQHKTVTAALNSVRDATDVKRVAVLV